MKEGLETLADGIDPLTGEILPEDSICNQAEIVCALHCVLDALQRKSRKKKQPENAGKPWTEEMDAMLCQMYDEGNTKREICATFKRSSGAITARWIHLGKLPERPYYKKW